MNERKCPEKQQLADYSSGKLAEREAAEVADHLVECRECEATIDSLAANSDTLGSGLRDAPLKEPFVDETGYKQALDRLKQIPTAKKPKPSPPSVPPPASPEATVPDKPKSKPAPKLGPYKLLAKLGEGGMGAVYKALHEHLEKVVAIKVLPKKAMQDPAAVARFRREMKAVGALHHPNIVGAHDAGEASGVHFLVMEYVEGRDLSNLVKQQGPLPVDKAVAYMLQAAKGLAFAHGKGIIHRDIKPANLLVDVEGTLKILDMGLARLDTTDAASAAAQEGLTQTGQVMGTVDYMAPEQAFDTHRADAKADVYSLGCTLYRILTGQNLFVANTIVQKILAHREQPPPPLVNTLPEVPLALDALYQRMVAKRPEDRPTMSEVAGALEAIQRSVVPGSPSSAAAVVADVTEDSMTAAFGSQRLRSLSEELSPGNAEARRRKTPATRSPRRAASAGGRKRPPLKWILAGAGGAALILLGVLIVIRGKDGEIASTTYVADNQRVELLPDGADSLATKQQPKEKSPAPTMAVAGSARDRELAEWALTNGGTISATIDGKLLFAREIANLPREPFALVHFNLPSVPISNDELKRLASAKTLTSVTVDARRMSDAAIDTLVMLPALDHLALSHSQFSAAALARLGTLTGPLRIDFQETNLTGMLARAAEIGNLRHLYIKQCQMRADDFVPLASAKSLTRIDLIDTPVGDDCIAALGNLAQLRDLGLQRTAITSDGVKRLAALLPKCQIDSDYGTFNAKGAPVASGAAPVGSPQAQSSVPRTPLADGPPGEIESIPLTSPGMGLVAAHDGRYVGIVDTVERVAQWIEIATGNVRWKRTLTERASFSQGVQAALSADGMAWAIPAERPFGAPWIYLVRTDDGAILQSIDTGGGVQVKTVALSHDGTRLAAGFRDGSVRLFELPGGRQLRTWAAHKDGVNSVAFSPAGDRLVSSAIATDDSSLKLWNAVTGEQLPFDATAAMKVTNRDVEFTPDGTLLVLGTNNSSAAVRDAATGKQLALIKNDQSVHSVGYVAIFPSGRHVVCGSSLLLVAELPSGRVIQALGEPGDDVGRVVITPDGRFAITTPPKENRLRVWRLPEEVWTPSSATPAPTVAAAPFDGKQAHAHQEAWAKHLGTTVETTDSAGGKLTLIPPGEFLMGATAAEKAWIEAMSVEKLQKDNFRGNPDFAREYIAGHRSQLPQHRVSLTRPFWLGQTEVTVGEFRRFTTATKYRTEGEAARLAKPADKRPVWTDPGFEQTDAYPVSCVSWDDAVAFCNWLSAQEGLPSVYAGDGKGNSTITPGPGYRLPTEAEWEFACRAGTVTQFYWGDDKLKAGDYCWTSENSGTAAGENRHPHPVAEKLPNAFRLFDIAGNLAEWVQDRYADDTYAHAPSVDPTGPPTGDSRVYRSSHWNYAVDRDTSAYRWSFSPKTFNHTNGFRIARTIVPANRPVLATDHTPDLTAAEWVLSKGGQIQGKVAGKLTEKMTRIDQLPAGFQLVTIVLNPEARIQDVELSHLHGLTELASIDFQLAQTVTDAGLVHLQALPKLASLKLSSQPITNDGLRVVERMPGLKVLWLGRSKVDRQGLPLLGSMTGLTELALVDLPVTDESLAVLQQLTNLNGLNLAGTPISGQGLRSLYGLKPLTSLVLYRTPNIATADVAALHEALPNCRIEWPAPNQFFGDVSMAARPITSLKDPAFQQWMKATQALPAEKQIEAVSKKLMELNPGFDGKLYGMQMKSAPTVTNGVINGVGMDGEHVFDLSPLRGVKGLTSVACFGHNGVIARLADLSPLEGLPLIYVNCMDSQVADLSPLRGMKLTTLYCNHTSVADLSPLAGMPLTRIEASQTAVADLSPLRGMPLRDIRVDRTLVTDLSPLADCHSLILVDVKTTKVTASGVAGLQKALPNCKIEWDGEKAESGKRKAEKIALEDPAFQRWLKETQSLPADKQLEAVRKKLMELNPGFDGIFLGWNGTGQPKIQNGAVTELWFFADEVADISPLRALAGLNLLRCSGTSDKNPSKLADLSPVAGLDLHVLYCANTMVSDLSPVAGMLQLRTLSCHTSEVSDLSPLADLKLTDLHLTATKVADLTPLAGMPLAHLSCGSTKVSDVSPLAACKRLETLFIERTNVTTAAVASLQQALPGCKIAWSAAKAENGRPKAALAFEDPAFQQWVEATQALSAEKQVEAISKKLMELNPRFDGTLKPTIVDGIATDLQFLSDSVTDISPVRALPQLKRLVCFGTHPRLGRLSDLAPLHGMKLNVLELSDTQVSDLSPLEGMKLRNLIFANTRVADLSPLRGMPLTDGLSCFNTMVADLSALNGASIGVLSIRGTQVTDLSPLESFRRLNRLDCRDTKVTPASVAALQKALPNCKIEWDGEKAESRTPKAADVK